MIRLTRDGTAEPVSPPNCQALTRRRKYSFFPVELTTCRIGNLTRLIHTLAICVAIHIIVHSCTAVVKILIPHKNQYSTYCTLSVGNLVNGDFEAFL